ncbi:3-dehydroquinate synthase [Rhodopirellula sallentina]|uniref:3-dehydroquinate synthase n=1 Tax=Rhodopirellula sallentina SM41 TaxID=1263870 RepID=M5U9Y4_9BACT|nr:3-dehydroquinate synthase [Rhodopirellula sallentina]EMI52823.1 3-dehydroquinate synthase [Rhodopirellula sallentina SM41]
MPIPPRNETSTASPSGISTITVDLDDRSYPIVINSGQTNATDPSGFATHFREALGDCTHAIIVQDTAIAASAGNAVADALGTDDTFGTDDTQGTAGQGNDDLRLSVIDVASGEPSKSTDRIAQLWNEMLDTAADRRSVVIAVGGGVIGDLAGFAAATFTRGLRLVQVPTTLLAMVDSSVGGKTGINLPGGKNLVGSFWQPHLVWIDTDFLKTLPEREYVSGLAEVIKYGVIEDAEFFDYLESNITAILDRAPEPTRHAIARSCESKARVVADDERETTGRRAILNYGHTFAHAIESTAGYGAFLHGEAVSIGMQMAAELSVRLGRCPAELLTRQTALLDAAGLPLRWKDADVEKMIAVMARDKKVAHGKLRFVLPDRIGNVELVGDVPADLVSAAIEACR